MDHRRLIKVIRPPGPATAPITTVNATETIVCGRVASAHTRMMTSGARSPAMNGTSPVSR